ncbi:Ig-like domain-containing protein, partial [Neobacillus vireti]|uniref:Ig-like domain-containing protein n=1 Tax=Neobacillus vireti TaxID=220686 RepID=UPI003000F58D
NWNGISNAAYHLTANFPDKSPTVNPVSDHSTSITGIAESNLKIYAYIGSKRLGYATSFNGKYSIPISKQTAGTLITVYSIDPQGNQSGNVMVKVLDKTPPPKPNVNPVSDQSTTITGTAESNSKVFAYIGNKMIGYATANGGKFTIKITKRVAGTVLNIYVQDAAGNRSGATAVKVLDKNPPSPPTVNTITSKTIYITGKAEPNSTVYIYNGNKIIGSGKVDGKGNFKIKIASQRKGTILKIYAQDAAKNRSSAKIVKVY